jgi:hypothetical protein
MADSLNTTTTSEIPDRNTPAEIVFEIEDDLSAAAGYAQATYLAGVGLSDFNKDAAQGVIRLGMELIRTTGELREAHGRLHEALHSDKPAPVAAALREAAMTRNPDRLYSAFSDLESPIHEIALMARIAEDMAQEVLCGPGSDELSDDERERLAWAVGHVCDMALVQARPASLSAAQGRTAGDTPGDRLA